MWTDLILEMKSSSIADDWAWRMADRSTRGSIIEQVTDV